MHAYRSLRFSQWSLLALAVTALLQFGCGDKGRRSSPAPGSSDAATAPGSPDAAAAAAGPGPVELWEGPSPPIPTRPSPRFVPLATLVTQRIDKTTAPRRIGELALEAAKEIGQIPDVEIRARQLARLCATVGPNVDTHVVDQLAQGALDATGRVTQLIRLQEPFEGLAKCLAHASRAKRASLLAAMLTRAAETEELSVFSWPFRSAGAALAQLTPEEIEPILRLAERLLPKAQSAFHKEHLLSGMAAAGTALPPDRALGLLARAEAGVAGPTFADSRPVFLGELAQSWVGLARRQPTLLDRAAQAIIRLDTSPYDRAAALDQLTGLPNFAGAPKALVVLKLIAGALPKLPAAEREWLRRKLIAQAAKVDGALDTLRILVEAADPEQAFRTRVVAVRALASESPKEALRYAEAAVGLLDKMKPGSQRNTRHFYLFRALARVDQQARKPFLTELEKRATGSGDRSFAARTLLKLLELVGEKNPEEALRLQGELMQAVDSIEDEAHRLRVLEAIYALGLSSGPAAAETVIARAITMTGTGMSGRIWWRFIQSVNKQPAEVQARWLPRLLTILVDHSSSWRPEDLASRARLVARLAPKVLSPPEAEALLLRAWQAVERAPRRSAEVETQHVVSALRAIGVGLAGLGSAHFRILVRRLLARIPRRKTWSEPLMSHVTSLGCLLSPDDGAGLQKRLEAWVAMGTQETQLMRRGAIVAGMVACHGTLDHNAIRSWQEKGPAELSWDPMVQFLIRLPLADLQAKAAQLPERRQRIRMYRILIGATIERGTRELSRWRGRRSRGRSP